MATTSIGDRVRALRKGAKLTQEGLARIVGVVSMTISRIERDEQAPDKKTLDALAKAFKVSPAFISFGIEEAKVSYDRDEEIERAAETAGLDEEQRGRLYDACRSIGPMSAGELLQTAERIARNIGIKRIDRAEAEAKRASPNLKAFR